MPRISPNYHSHVCPSCEQPFECLESDTDQAVVFCEDCPRVVYLKCKDDSPSYDQRLRAVYLEKMDDQGFWGRPVANAACPTLLWPSFAWREVYGVVALDI